MANQFSVNQIGRFLKILDNKFSCKNSPNICDYFEDMTFEANMLKVLFEKVWGKLGYSVVQHLVTLPNYSTVLLSLITVSKSVRH